MKVDIAVSTEEADPGPCSFFDGEVLSPLVSSLFDQVWPRWKDGGDVSVSVALVSEEKIRELNRTYGGPDSATDVLSFSPWEEEGRFCPPEGWDMLPLGDVVICPEVVKKNARDRDGSFQREMALVFFHSLLHLLGWDHDTEEKEIAMWSVQERYRDLLIARLETAGLLTGQEG